jgi:hypothetical protein
MKMGMAIGEFKTPLITAEKPTERRMNGRFGMHSGCKSYR